MAGENEGTPGGNEGGAKTALDAINEALGLTGDEDAPDTGAADTGADGGVDLEQEEIDPSVDEGAEGADDSDEQGGEEAGGDKPAGQGARAAEGADKHVVPTYSDLVKDAAKLGIQQRNADGTIKSGQQLAAEIAAKKGGDAAGKPGAKKEPDALNDPIDKSLKQETQQRIRTLIDTTKEANTRAEQAEGNFNTMMGGLQAANVTPEQYGETLSFLALFNSGDPNQQGQALDILEDMADKLATLLGKERRSTDPLAAHADLRAEVQAGKLTVERAKEIARHRNQGAFRTELTNAGQKARSDAQRAEQELNTAREALNQLGEQLMQSDPLFMRKRAAIAPYLKRVFAKLPPSQWLATFKEEYNSVRLAAAPRQQQGGRQIPANQPLRGGKSPAGSGANANGGSGLNDGGPKTMLDAVNGALASMR